VTARDEVARVVESALSDADLEWERLTPYSFTVTLPGTRKLQTPCRLDVGEHALSVHAFVARHPDENHEGVYRWLLERNLRLYGVAFAVDHNGDIHLDGRLPLAGIDAAEIDRLLGSVLSYADESFNTILELGFASSIRREWEWRRSRGEPTHNLEAFRGWLEQEGSGA
jgi:Putative bacterial sensory transduction regulator